MDKGSYGLHCLDGLGMKHGGDIWEMGRLYGMRPWEVIDFSASINPLGPPPGVEEAMVEGIRLISNYPEPESFSMRMELASYHEISRHNLLVGNGSTEFIYLIPRILQPKEALVIEPAFGEYRASLIANGCGVDTFRVSEESGFSPDIGRLFDALRKRYGVLYLGNPSNPAGALLDNETVLGIALECKRYGTTLVVDEAFMDFAGNSLVKCVSDELENVIILRSMTKFFALAGLRLGYVIAERRMIGLLMDSMPPWSVNTLASMAGVECLRDKKYIAKTRDWLKGERPFVQRGLSSIPGLKPFTSSANYILVKILAKEMDAKTLQLYLLKDGILIRDCTSFVGLGMDFFRVAIRERAENSVLLDKLKCIMSTMSSERISPGSPGVREL